MPSFLLKKMNGGDHTPHDPKKFKKYAEKCKVILSLFRKEFNYKKKGSNLLIA